VKIKHKAWAIGLGRTGTTSFCDALKIIGYRNVVHNPVFEELKNLDGASDNGCTIFYKYLDIKFPGSKFVLLTRELKSWLDSAEYMHGPVDMTNDLAIMRRMLIYGTIEFNRETFTHVYHRHHEEVREYFRQRPDDLLEMDITAGEGWEILCPFLGLPIPEEPFPFRNKRIDGVQSGSSTIAKKVALVKHSLRQKIKSGKDTAS
jgi:hypothetical protein